MGHVEADWTSQVHQIAQPNKVVDQPVVAEERAALREHDLPAAALVEFLKHVPHFPRRNELALLHVHRLARGRTSHQ